MIVSWRLDKEEKEVYTRHYFMDILKKNYCKFNHNLQQCKNYHNQQIVKIINLNMKE